LATRNADGGTHTVTYVGSLIHANALWIGHVRHAERISPAPPAVNRDATSIPTAAAAPAVPDASAATRQHDSFELDRPEVVDLAADSNGCMATGPQLPQQTSFSRDGRQNRFTRDHREDTDQGFVIRPTFDTECALADRVQH
jgi:hypothetical protein